MDGVKIGGIYYGMDIQKAMEKAHKLVMESAIRVFKDDYEIKVTMVALECYEQAFLEKLKGGESKE